MLELVRFGTWILGEFGGSRRSSVPFDKRDSEQEREMKAAIVFHLEGLAEEGAPVPEPSGPGVYVERKKRAAA